MAMIAQMALTVHTFRPPPKAFRAFCPNSRPPAHYTYENAEAFGFRTLLLVFDASASPARSLVTPVRDGSCPELWFCNEHFCYAAMDGW